MPSPFPDNPDTLKFLKSTCVAFPFDRDPWGIMAGGFRVDVERIVSLYAAACSAGWVAGVWGEPNVGLADAREALVQFDAPPPLKTAEGTVRWMAQLPSGRWMASVFALGRSPGAGWNARRFLKAGVALPQGDDPLAGSTDRTSIVADDPVHIPPLKYDEFVFGERLFVPQPVDSGGSFWAQLASGTPFDDEQVRLLVRQMVYHHVWRRFSLRLNLHALGVRGCGMAMWHFQSETEVVQAASALAVLRGTGDVVVREASPEGNLTAVFLARENGHGERAAREVARQWGRDIVMWTDLAIR